MAAEMSVPESDLGLVRVGRVAAFKLNAFPTTTFEGAVERIGTQTRGRCRRAVFSGARGVRKRRRPRPGWHGGPGTNSRRGWMVSERVVSIGICLVARSVQLVVARNLDLAALRDEHDQTADTFLSYCDASYAVLVGCADTPPLRLRTRAARVPRAGTRQPKPPGLQIRHG